MWIIDTFRYVSKCFLGNVYIKNIENDLKADMRVKLFKKILSQAFCLFFLPWCFYLRFFVLCLFDKQILIFNKLRLMFSNEFIHPFMYYIGTHICF